MREASTKAATNRKADPGAHRRNYGHRAASVRVESGTWMFCPEMTFQGECRIFGPGAYPQLSGPLATGIASAQQVRRVEYGALNTYTRY